MDVRIGVSQAPRELNLELPDDTDREALQASANAALAGDVDTLWLTDRRGRLVGVPSRRAQRRMIRHDQQAPVVAAGPQAIEHRPHHPLVDLLDGLHLAGSVATVRTLVRRLHVQKDEVALGEHPERGVDRGGECGRRIYGSLGKIDDEQPGERAEPADDVCGGDDGTFQRESR